MGQDQSLEDGRLFGIFSTVIAKKFHLFKPIVVSMLLRSVIFLHFFAALLLALFIALAKF